MLLQKCEPRSNTRMFSFSSKTSESASRHTIVVYGFWSLSLFITRWHLKTTDRPYRKVREEYLNFNIVFPKFNYIIFPPSTFWHFLQGGSIHQLNCDSSKHAVTRFSVTLRVCFSRIIRLRFHFIIYNPNSSTKKVFFLGKFEAENVSKIKITAIFLQLFFELLILSILIMGLYEMASAMHHLLLQALDVIT